MQRVVLPVEARDPRRVARRLAPTKDNGLLVLEVCRGLDCRVCVFPERPRIVIRWMAVRDPLSGLRMRLPVVWAEVCGRTVWRARWRRGMLSVESVSCAAVLEGDCVRLESGECVPRDRAIDVLRRLCGVSDAGRGHSPGAGL